MIRQPCAHPYVRVNKGTHTGSCRRKPGTQPLFADVQRSYTSELGRLDPRVGGGVSGTVTIAGVRTVFATIRELFKGRFCFIDIGAHTGRMLLLSVSRTPGNAVMASGIELEPANVSGHIFNAFRTRHNSERVASIEYGEDIAEQDSLPHCGQTAMSRGLHKVVFAFDDGFNTEDRQAMYALVAADRRVKVFFTTRQRSQGAIFTRPERVLEDLNDNEQTKPFSFHKALNLNMSGSGEHKTMWCFYRKRL